MNGFIKEHFEEWLDKTISWYNENERKKVYNAIEKLLIDNPDLIEKGYSWPEMRRLCNL